MWDSGTFPGSQTRAATGNRRLTRDDAVINNYSCRNNKDTVLVARFHSRPFVRARVSQNTDSAPLCSVLLRAARPTSVSALSPALSRLVFSTRQFHSIPSFLDLFLSFSCEQRNIFYSNSTDTPFQATLPRDDIDALIYQQRRNVIITTAHQSFAGFLPSHSFCCINVVSTYTHFSHLR